MEQNKKNVIVVGGYGFIGSAIVRSLIRSSEYHIYIVDKLAQGVSKSSIQYNRLITFIQSDVTNINNYIHLLPNNSDFIINCTNTLTNIVVIKDDNNNGFISSNQIDYIHNMNEEMHKEEQRIIDCVDSLANITRSKKTIHFSTILAFQNELNSLGYSKKQMEKYLNEKLTNIPFLIIRLPILYGIFQGNKQFISSIILHALMQKNIFIKEDPSSVYEWAFIDDISESIRSLLNTEVNNIIYTISGEKLSVQEICNKILSLIDNKGVKVQYINHSRCNLDHNPINQISQLNNYESVDERLALTIEFYEDNLHYYTQLERGDL